MRKTALATALACPLLIAVGSGAAHAAPATAPTLAVDDGKVDVEVSAAGQQIGIIDNVAIVNAVTLVNSVCPASGITEANLIDLDTNNTAVGQPCAAADGTSFRFTQNTGGKQKAAAKGTSASGASSSGSSATSKPKAKS